jgi:hypothetical protein
MRRGGSFRGEFEIRYASCSSRCTLYDGLQLGGVGVRSAVDAVDRHVAGDELRNVLDPVLVAARVVAAIERRELAVGHEAKDAPLA